MVTWPWPRMFGGGVPAFFWHWFKASKRWTMWISSGRWWLFSSLQICEIPQPLQTFFKTTSSISKKLSKSYRSYQAHMRLQIKPKRCSSGWFFSSTKHLFLANQSFFDGHARLARHARKLRIGVHSVQGRLGAWFFHGKSWKWWTKLGSPVGMVWNFKHDTSLKKIFTISFPDLQYIFPCMKMINIPMSLVLSNFCPSTNFHKFHDSFWWISRVKKSDAVQRCLWADSSILEMCRNWGKAWRTTIQKTWRPTYWKHDNAYKSLIKIPNSPKLLPKHRFSRLHR